MIYKGRRIGSEGSQVMCTKLPGAAAASHFGARRRMMYSSPANVSQNRITPYKTKIITPFSCACSCAAVSAMPLPCRHGLADAIKYRHANGDAIGDLLRDHRLWPIGQ